MNKEFRTFLLVSGGVATFIVAASATAVMTKTHADESAGGASSRLDVSKLPPPPATALASGQERTDDPEPEESTVVEDGWASGATTGIETKLDE